MYSFTTLSYTQKTQEIKKDKKICKKVLTGLFFWCTLKSEVEIEKEITKMTKEMTKTEAVEKIEALADALGLDTTKDGWGWPRMCFKNWLANDDRYAEFSVWATLKSSDDFKTYWTELEFRCSICRMGEIEPEKMQAAAMEMWNVSRFVMKANQQFKDVRIDVNEVAEKSEN